MKKLVTLVGGRRWRQDLLPILPSSGLTRGERRSVSSLIRERQNDIASFFKLELLLYANFKPDDWYITLTYDDANLPPTWRDAKKKPPAFFRKIREYRKPKDLPCGYVYVHENLHSEGRPHHHIVLHRADGDKDFIRECWGRGFVDIVTIENFGGYQKLAKYITKEPREKGKPVVGERMWTPSKGLIRPIRTEDVVPDTYVLCAPADSTPIEEGLSQLAKVMAPFSEFPRCDAILAENVN